MNCVVVSDECNSCVVAVVGYIQVAPILSMGIERLETDTLVLQCLQTLTGVKFVITATPGTTEMKAVLQNVYEIYTDYVLKVRGAVCTHVKRHSSWKWMCLLCHVRILFMKWRCRFAATFSTSIWTEWCRKVTAVKRGEEAKLIACELLDDIVWSRYRNCQRMKWLLQRFWSFSLTCVAWLRKRLWSYAQWVQITSHLFFVYSWCLSIDVLYNWSYMRRLVNVALGTVEGFAPLKCIII